jgi:hypothetical protein
MPKYLSLIFIFAFKFLNAQNDSIPKLSANQAYAYATKAQEKLISYTSKVNTKTIKTLTKYIKWENKIKRLLQKADPAKAAELFSNNSLSFEKLLAQYQAGALQINNVHMQYNSATDKLETSVKYIKTQKDLLTPKQQLELQNSDSIINEFEAEEKQQALLVKLIKERQQQLIAAAGKQIKNSKYFKKLNEEFFYYSEAINNYRAVLNDPNKMEALAISILEKIPAFKSFFRQFSQIGQMFPQPANGATSMASLAGLQTRASVMAQITSVIGTAPAAQENFSNLMQSAQQQLNTLKQKAQEAVGGANNDFELPQPKKYNSQKNKSLWNRMALKADWQPVNNNGYIPNNINMGLGLTYKINDKKEIGAMVSYKLGLGNGIRDIRLPTKA